MIWLMHHPSRLNPDDDPFRPPAIPTEVHCLHCGQEYESYLIQWCEEVGEDGSESGRWCCPMPGCNGAGFGIDLLPTDPDYVGEDGEEMWDAGGGGGDDDDDEDDDDGEDWVPGAPGSEELNFDDSEFDDQLAEWQGHEGPLDPLDPRNSQAEKRGGPDELDADDIPW